MGFASNINKILTKKGEFGGVKTMWCNGRKFHIKQLDETRKIFDSGIVAVFQVTNVSSRSDRHP
jgi:hypothetical protein